jgi:hypothetical protein
MTSTKLCLKNQGTPKLRTEVYVQKPAKYGISGCTCGADAQTAEWSTLEEHLWCPACQKDFVPEQWGVFDGPIPLHTTMALGICFDRRRLADNAILMFNPATLEHVPSGKAGSP